MTIALFPFSEYWWFYAAFTGFVWLLLAVDLGLFHREAHDVSFREAAIWSVIWVTLALAFNYLLYQYGLWTFSRDPRLTALPAFDPQAAARQSALEFLAGYVVEKALSVDNIFVFVAVFGYFAIPTRHQHRVLFYGILGALACRALFIALGAVLLQYHWVVWLFGGFLILTGLKMLVGPDKGHAPEKNPVIRLFRRFVSVTPDLHGQRFFVRIQGALHATPLFITLLFIELTDVVFAVDSVPAIFALTDEPLIVFTSNIFAILGLRAMYFLLAGAVKQFRLLKYGLALVLIFVGLKMVWLNDWYGGKFPISLSLGVIAAVIGAVVVLSVVLPSGRGEAKHTPPTGS
jgi:tellurite resistance protein TerC